MARITGLGGVFLSANGDTRRLLDWYHQVLGLEVSEYGINFLAPNLFALLTFEQRASGDTVLNFTVDDLAQFLDSLQAKGVQVTQEIKVYEYGKFARIADPLGNTVELWEPFCDAYRRLVEQEIADFRKTRTGE